MQVNYSGWNEKLLRFDFTIDLDETRKDYEIHFKDGFVSKQSTPFDYVTCDWNHDGDVYCMYGAYFTSRFGGNVFWTPDEMVSALIESAMEDGYRDTYRIREIPGIALPPALRKKEKLPTLKEKLTAAAASRKQPYPCKTEQETVKQSSKANSREK